ncbi:hypothetical protein K490DRAFT_56961 [Saccharata proteae CBS 121410]|uniref:Extracellular membrane protein CFEM domain-containing protein n=1 Tax=Saccharata proteae CBS 121410 TaxID=1314787 RepID=A0A9P4LYQ6_9PEZI|nr:hypothetical protein K490DRAFT_56961 [Saccharata proteae CBS 121410]
MHLSLMHPFSLLLLLLVPRIHAVSLADFSPRVDGLTGTCEIVYNQQIPSCTANDLATGQACSEDCVNGLTNIANLVKSSCADANVAANSIVGVFLSGNGPSTLCKNLAVTTVNTLSGTESVGQSTVQLSSATALPSGIVVDTSAIESTEASATKTTTLPSGVSSSFQLGTTAIVTETPTVTSEITMTATASSATSTSSSKNDQYFGGSGGGSPFDMATGSAPTFTASAWLSLACALLALRGL